VHVVRGHIERVFHRLICVEEQLPKHIEHIEPVANILQLPLSYTLDFEFSQKSQFVLIKQHLVHNQLQHLSLAEQVPGTHDDIDHPVETVIAVQHLQPLCEIEALASQWSGGLIRPTYLLVSADRSPAEQEIILLLVANHLLHTAFGLGHG